MSAEFLDSNVFLYLFDETDDHKRGVAERLVQRALSDGSGVISFQVVQETLNVMTRKLGASTSDARRFLDNVLLPLWRIAPSPALYASALDVRDRYGFGFYDALILAAAIDHGCTRVWSEDLQDGQKVAGVEVVDPFG